MKNLKKAICMLLASTMSLTLLGACGQTGTSEESADTANSTASSSVSSTSTVTDNSVTDNSATDSSATDETPYDNPYDILGLGEIPVGIWVSLPDELRTDEQFKTMRACGINFINGIESYESNTDKIRAALTLAGDNGMKYLINDGTVTLCLTKYQSTKNAKYIKQAMDQIENYYDYPAYAGQLLMDEPFRAQFEDLKAFIDAYKENYPSKQWHINFFPKDAEAGGLGAPYEQYVDDWLELVQPNYYSYDNYPLLEYDPDDYNPRPETENYFYNLDIIRAKTNALNIPYWTFIQTLQYGTQYGMTHREPSREDIRWQVFSNFAFGAKGIQYFCYYTPLSGSEVFSPALLDRDGNTTVRYDYVKELNEEFNEYGKILLRCNAEGVILSGVNKSLKRYTLYEDALENYGPVDSVSGTCLVGCLKDGKTDQYDLLVTSVTPRDGGDVTLSIASYMKQATVWTGGVAQTVDIENGTLSFHIDAGDAVFIQF